MSFLNTTSFRPPSEIAQVWQTGLSKSRHRSSYGIIQNSHAVCSLPLKESLKHHDDLSPQSHPSPAQLPKESVNRGSFSLSFYTTGKLHNNLPVSKILLTTLYPFLKFHVQHSTCFQNSTCNTPPVPKIPPVGLYLFPKFHL